jgi:ATP-dependent Lon protease
LSLPWGVYSKDSIDISQAKKILDDDHYGLEEVKDRILDYLSIHVLKEDCNTPLLCFAGPPGVGKTSLGKSIARCMNRKFFRLSLGGVHDESEIRGHRRTYVGALPGRFVQGLRKTKTANPVFMIDEIDKIGASGKGDPASALLEVLDPEQNVNFYDNYLGVHFDLSKVIFIATANDISSIPAPLRDRMEIIQLSGYTFEEKIEIAHRHLLEKAIQSTGLANKGIEISKNVIGEIITGYTREAGVRSLERTIQKLCSKYARAIVEKNKKIEFTAQNINQYLGIRKVPLESNLYENKIGVTNALAWTPYGGDVLQVEAVLTPGKGRLILTGQLGDVMKESAQAAVTFAKSHAKLFDIDKKLFTKYDLHIHLPAGAIPKDGPSAGVTLLSSIFSVFTGRPINATYAMTGELNLQGNVLPIGGIKEKILAAKQRGLHNIILPKLNKKDLEGLEGVSKDLNIFFVEKAEEVLDHVLLPQIGAES